MKNLAGNKECDVDIERELTRCGIEIVRDQPREGEVPSSLRGTLGSLTFSRAWYYWMVRGSVPLAIAKELYADPVGRTDIRVNGHCGCPAPGGEDGGYATWRDPETMKQLVTHDEWNDLQRRTEELPSLKPYLDESQPSDDPTTGEAFIEGYHIDSEVGLRLFADILKKHNSH